MERTYAKALWKLSREAGADTAKLVSRLTEHLGAAGRMKLLPRILRELKALDARSVGAQNLVEAARPEDVSAASAAAKDLGLDLMPTINPSLVRGWRIRANGSLIDRSGKRALIDLYRSITA